MKCPHCQKQIEDRWIYPVGQKLFKRGLYNSFKNVEILEQCLSVDGYSIYKVRETYCLTKEDTGGVREYLTSHAELSLFDTTTKRKEE